MMARRGMRCTRDFGWSDLPVRMGGDGPPTRPAILSDVQVTQALDALIDVFAAPPEDVTRRISAALDGVVAHRAAAVLAGACARSPMTVHGESGLAERITSADLARLAATVPVGEAWRGASVVAGAERPLLAVAAAG